MAANARSATAFAGGLETGRHAAQNGRNRNGGRSFQNHPATGFSIGGDRPTSGRLDCPLPKKCRTFRDEFSGGGGTGAGESGSLAQPGIGSPAGGHTARSAGGD